VLAEHRGSLNVIPHAGRQIASLRAQLAAFNRQLAELDAQETD
jgi:hypothetical protein